MNFIKYSQRLLNPFRGSMNIIDYQGAEAVSLDGIHWDIYVKNIAIIQDMDSRQNIQTSDIRYGSWSPEKGLKRGAIYPSDDFKRMEKLGAKLYDYLLDHYQQAPFPFLDNYELWLLNEKAEPLALIDSTRCEHSINEHAPLDWRAGQCCCREFESSAYLSIKKQRTRKAHASINAGKYLTRYINKLSCHPPQAQWFKRTMDGHGIGLRGINISDNLLGRELAEATFYPFMLSDTGHDTLHINLINDFILWQSPWLLLLDTLSESQRIIFEEASCKHAVMVDRLHHLYPEIIDDKTIITARVEAVLRKNNTIPSKPESIMSTEYIEYSAP